MENVLVLKNIQEFNGLVDLDFSILCETNSHGLAGSFIRKDERAYKNQITKTKSGVDEYGRVWITNTTDDKKIKYIVCTREIAEKTCLI